MYNKVISNIIARSPDKLRMASLRVPFTHHDTHPRTNDEAYWVGPWKGVRSDSLLSLLDGWDYTLISKAVVSESPISTAKLIRTDGFLMFNSAKDEGFNSLVQLSKDSDYASIINLSDHSVSISIYNPSKEAKFTNSPIKKGVVNFEHDVEVIVLEFNDMLLLSSDSVVSFPESDSDSIEGGNLYAILLLEEIASKH
jgi:hypothetical protein